MSERTLEKCIEQLKQSDTHNIVSRAKRCLDLPVIQHSSTPQKEWDYSDEASKSFVVGNYRSTIFCCTCAVDQIIRYEYLKTPGNNINELGNTFGQLKKACRTKGGLRLSKSIDQAELLNKIRNIVAAQPLFIDPPIESDPKGLLRKKLLLKDIRSLLNLVKVLDPKLEIEIRSTTLNDKVVGINYTFGRIVDEQEDMPLNLDAFWGLIERDILRFLAIQSWCILKYVIERLNGVTQ